MFVRQILLIIFRSFKIKIKLFWISYHNHIFSHYYSFFFIVIFLISSFNLYEFFLAFTCVKKAGSLVNNLFGVNILNLFLSLTYSSSPSSAGMSDESKDSPLSVDSPISV